MSVPPYSEGQRVRARIVITEAGPDTKPDFYQQPPFFSGGFVHAPKGGMGTIVHIDSENGMPTVQWDRLLTATIVGDEEIEVIK